MITQPGVYTLSAEEYHADPCPAPSLSASVAQTLLSASPAHAWAQHPRLNTAYQPETDEGLELGTAAHSYMLQGVPAFVTIDAADYRTRAAQQQRDAARAAGKVPLLVHRWTDLQAMALAVWAQLQRHEPPVPLTDGAPEQTVVWQEGAVWCRARLDWLSHDHRWVDDLKTTGGSAEPASWMRRRLFEGGYDIQAAFYTRGVKVLFGIEPEFRFVVAESRPPYGVSVIGLGPEAMALAKQKITAAIAGWAFCLKADNWPGYPTRTCWADVPPWEEARWLDHQALAELPS